MNPLPKASFPLVVTALIGLSGCSSDRSTSPTDTGTLQVEAITQTTLSGIVGTAANPTPTVRVTDRRTHKPVSNVTVDFRLADRSGSVTNTSVVTDATGLASSGEWDFSTYVGINYLKVYVGGTLQLTFAATTKAGAPAVLLAANLSDYGIGLPGTVVDGPDVVVRDRFANRVPNVSVSFATTAGGTLQFKSAITDDYGYASAGTWTLVSPGVNHATATVSEIESAEFTATVIDTSTVKWYALEGIRSAQQITPLKLGITYARLGLTTFDPCLCKRQQGYFIDELQFSTGSASFAGHYILDGTTLYLNEYDENGSIDGNSLFRDRNFGMSETWVYKEINP